MTSEAAAGLAVLAEMPLRIGSFNLEKFGPDPSPPTKDVSSFLVDILKRYDVLLLMEKKLTPTAESNIDRIKKRLNSVDKQNPFHYEESEAKCKSTTVTEQFCIFYRVKKLQVVAVHRYDDGPFSMTGWKAMPRRGSVGTGVEESRIPTNQTIDGRPMSTGPIRPKSSTGTKVTGTGRGKDTKKKSSPSAKLTAEGGAAPIDAVMVVGKKIADPGASQTMEHSSIRFETSLDNVNYVHRKASRREGEMEEEEDDWELHEVGLHKSVSSVNLIDFMSLQNFTGPSMGGLAEADREESDEYLGGKPLTELPLPSPPISEKGGEKGEDDDEAPVEENPVGLRQSISSIDLMDRADYYRMSSKMRNKIRRASLMEESSEGNLDKALMEFRQEVSGSLSDPSIALNTVDIDDEDPNRQIIQIGLKKSVSNIDLAMSPKTVSKLQELAESEPNTSGENNSHPPVFCIGTEQYLDADVVIDELNIGTALYRKPLQGGQMGCLNRVGRVEYCSLVQDQSELLMLGNVHKPNRYFSCSDLFLESFADSQDSNDKLHLPPSRCSNEVENISWYKEKLQHELAMFDSFPDEAALEAEFYFGFQEDEEWECVMEDIIQNTTNSWEVSSDCNFSQCDQTSQNKMTKQRIEERLTTRQSAHADEVDILCTSHIKESDYITSAMHILGDCENLLYGVQFANETAPKYNVEKKSGSEVLKRHPTCKPRDKNQQNNPDDEGTTVDSADDLEDDSDSEEEEAENELSTSGSQTADIKHTPGRRDSRISFMEKTKVQQIPNRFQSYSISATKKREKGRRLAFCGCCDFPHPFKKGKKFQSFEEVLKHPEELKRQEELKRPANLSLEKSEKGKVSPQKSADDDENDVVVQVDKAVQTDSDELDKAPDKADQKDNSGDDGKQKSKQENQNARTLIFGMYHPNLPSTSALPSRYPQDGDDEALPYPASPASLSSLLFDYSDLGSEEEEESSSVNGDSFSDAHKWGSSTDRNLNRNWMVCEATSATLDLSAPNVPAGGEEGFRTCPRCGGIRLDAHLIICWTNTFGLYNDPLRFLRAYSSSRKRDDYYLKSPASFNKFLGFVSDLPKDIDEYFIKGIKRRNFQSFSFNRQTLWKLQAQTNLPPMIICSGNVSQQKQNVPQKDKSKTNQGGNANGLQLSLENCTGGGDRSTKFQRAQSLDFSVDALTDLIPCKNLAKRQIFYVLSPTANSPRISSFGLLKDKNANADGNKIRGSEKTSVDNSIESLERSWRQRAVVRDKELYCGNCIQTIYGFEENVDIKAMCDKPKPTVSDDNDERNCWWSPSLATHRLAGEERLPDHGKQETRERSTDLIGRISSSFQQTFTERTLSAVCEEGSQFDLCTDDDHDRTTKRSDVKDMNTVSSDVGDREGDTNSNADKTGVSTGGVSSEALAQVFCRKPFAVFFQCSYTEVTEFAILVMHMDSDDARNEVLAIQRLFDVTSNKWQLENILIAGTFVMDENVRGLPHWRGLAVKSDRRFVAMTRSSVASMHVPPSKERNYDRFVLVGLQLNRAYINSSVGYFSYDDALCLSSSEVADVSDHYPIEIQLAGIATTRWQQLVQTKAGVVIEQVQTVPPEAVLSMVKQIQGSDRHAYMIRITKRGVTNIVECLKGFQRTYPDILLDTTISVATSFAASPLLTTAPFYGMVVTRDIKYDVTVTVSLRHPHICSVQIYRRLGNGSWNQGSDIALL